MHAVNVQKEDLYIIPKVLQKCICQYGALMQKLFVFLDLYVKVEHAQ